MITIIDYGLGNVLAFENMYRRLNIPVSIAKTADVLSGADKLILPGVGSFDQAIRQLKHSGMHHAIEQLVLHEGVPVLGICVGMQILANSSEEGRLAGLGWIDGTVKRFDVDRLPHCTHLPHMGWNDVESRAKGGLFKELEQDSRFYFLHSYFFECHNPSDILATSDYGGKFSSAINHSNVYGVQFHPEKSHHFGSQLLKNYAEL